MHLPSSPKKPGHRSRGAPFLQTALSVLLCTTYLSSWTTPARADPPAASHEQGKVDLGALNAEVVRLHDEGRFDLAVSAAERALHLVGAKTRPLDRATALSNRAALHHTLGQYGEAARLHEEARSLREKWRARDPAAYVGSLVEIGSLRTTIGDYAGARHVLEEALRAAERDVGPRSAAAARALVQLGRLHAATSDLGVAEDEYRSAIDIQQVTLGLDHLDVAATRIALASLYLVKGDLARAQQSLVAGQAVIYGRLGPAHPRFAEALLLGAVIETERGNISTAEPVVETALAIATRALGPDHPELSAGYAALGRTLVETGNLGGALAVLQRGLQLAEKGFGRDSPRLIPLLLGMASVHVWLDDGSSAEVHAARAQRLAETLVGAESLDNALALNTLAAARHRLNRSSEALALLRRARSIWERRTGPGHFRLVSLEDNLSALCSATGDLQAAVQHAELAAALVERAFGPSHPRAADVYASLARIRIRTGDVPGALVALSRSVDAHEAGTDSLLTLGSEDRKRWMMASMAADVDLAVSFHVRHAPRSADARRLALLTILRRKGRVLDAVIDGKRLQSRLVSGEDVAEAERLFAIRSRIREEMEKAGRGLASLPPEELLGLETEAEQLRVRQRAREADFYSRRPKITIEAVQSAVPPGAALVEIVWYRPLEQPGGPGLLRWGTPRYAAYVLHATGEPQWVELGDAATIDRESAALRQAMARPAGEGAEQRARALDAIIMEPVRPLLRGARTILLSPDGALSVVPFGALVDEAGRYLMERYLFTYLPSGRDLLSLASPRRNPGEAVIVANPDYGVPAVSAPTPATSLASPGGAPPAVTRRFMPLPATMEEASTLLSMLPGARLLSGGAASEQALNALHGPRILHIITHGFFSRELAAHPDPGTGAGASAMLPAVTRNLPGEAALRRSGLALSGANLGGPDDSDGVLTADEVLALDLSGTQLVVLSACETALGEIEEREGVFGLRRAFVVAGAETQMLSLWEVQPTPTRLMMREYYTRLIAGGGRSESLRQAQLAVASSERWRHPAYWAAFIVSGDGRTLDGRTAPPIPPPVAPGPRGCACTAVGYAGPRFPWGWLAGSTAVLFLRRRSRLAARTAGSRPEGWRARLHSQGPVIIARQATPPSHGTSPSWNSSRSMSRRRAL